MTDGAIRFTGRILRKQDDLPRYVVVPADLVTGRSSSFKAYVEIGGSPPFERNIRPWGKGSDIFFFNLTEIQCRKAGVETGEECEIVIRPKD